jgi:4-hydroxybenzoate polyprenyltransferase
VFFGNFACVMLLFFYSSHFKRKMLIGNLVISALTAWVILVIYFYVGASFFGMGVWRTSGYIDMKKLFILSFMYGAFAFVITLIREVVKDLEDMYGDSRFHCKTLPIAFGVPVAKVFTAVWLVVAIIGLLLLQLYAWHAGWWWGVAYAVFFIIIPLLYSIKLLYKAHESKNYHQISNVLKWVMFFGILSMIFFKFLK